LDEREQQEMISQEAVLYLPFPVDEADIDSVKLGKWVDEDGIEKIQVLLLGSRKNTLVESESDDAPQTPLVKKLWEIRQRAIASGMQLLDEAEIEQELAERRGGYRES
jgi:Tfp pilus assembly PilM family ATPase